jgi:hypothetical protein
MEKIINLIGLVDPSLQFELLERGCFSNEPMFTHLVFYCVIGTIVFVQLAL